MSLAQAQAPVLGSEFSAGPGPTTDNVTLTLGSTPTAGNLMFAWLASNGNSATITAPTGWTLVPGTALLTGVTTEMSGGWYHRVVVAGDGTAYTWSFTLSAGFATYNGCIFEWKGVNTVAPVDGGSLAATVRSSGGTTTLTGPTMTSTAGGSRAFFAGLNASSTAGTASAFSAGSTVDANEENNGNFFGLALTHSGTVASGASLTPTITWPTMTAGEELEGAGFFLIAAPVRFTATDTRTAQTDSASFHSVQPVSVTDTRTAPTDSPGFSTTHGFATSDTRTAPSDSLLFTHPLTTTQTSPSVSDSLGFVATPGGGVISTPQGPVPPVIETIAQANGQVILGIRASLVTGNLPVVSFNIFSSFFPLGPFALAVADVPVAAFSVKTLAYDPAPVLDQQQWYVVTAVDSNGAQSANSSPLSYRCLSPASLLQENNVLLGPRGISAAAYGTYPLLGSDTYLDPYTKQPQVGPNGDFLTINGLELLAQDLRIRLFTEIGELLLHPSFGFERGKIIGSGQASPSVQAQQLRTALMTALLADARVLEVTNVTITQIAPDGWGIAYTVRAIGVEDPLNANLTFPFYLGSTAAGRA